MDAEIVGLKIKELRKKAGLTQSELGEKIGVSYKAVSKWENGKGLPDVTLFPSLAKVFGVRMDELLFDVEVSEKDNDLEISERMENFQTEETFTESVSDAEVTLDCVHYADEKSEKADATVETMPNRKNWVFRIAAISACVLCAFSGIFYFIFGREQKGGKFVFEAEYAQTRSSLLVIEQVSLASNGACVANMTGSSLLFYIDSDREEENVSLKIYISSCIKIYDEKGELISLRGGNMAGCNLCHVNGRLVEVEGTLKGSGAGEELSELSYYHWSEVTATIKLNKGLNVIMVLGDFALNVDYIELETEEANLSTKETDNIYH